MLVFFMKILKLFFRIFNLDYFWVLILLKYIDSMYLVLEEKRSDIVLGFLWYVVAGAMCKISSRSLFIFDIWPFPISFFPPKAGDINSLTLLVIWAFRSAWPSTMTDYNLHFTIYGRLFKLLLTVETLVTSEMYSLALIFVVCKCYVSDLYIENDRSKNHINYNLWKAW